MDDKEKQERIEKLIDAVTYCYFSEFKKIADTYSDEELQNLIIPKTKVNSDGKVVPYQCPVLHHLAFAGYSDYEPDNEKVEYLLKRGYDVNKTDEDGYTALSMTKSSGNLTTAIVLLQNGADPYAKSCFYEYETYYDSMFDKDGNYRDFAYQRHDAKRAGTDNPEYIRDTKLFEDRLQTIRALCKPEFEGKPISKSPEVEYSYFKFNGRRGEDTTRPNYKRCSSDTIKSSIDYWYPCQIFLKVSKEDNMIKDIVLIDESEMRAINEIKDKNKKNEQKSDFLRYTLELKKYGFDPLIEKGWSFEDFPERAHFSLAMDENKRGTRIYLPEWKEKEQQRDKLISWAQEHDKARKNYWETGYKDKDPLEEKAKKYAENEASKKRMIKVLYNDKEVEPQKLHNDIARKNWQDYKKELKEKKDHLDYEKKLKEKQGR